MLQDAPGILPTVTSGRPKVALSFAILQWQAKAVSNALLKDTPCIPAMTCVGYVSK